MNGVTKLTMTENISLVFFERLPADGASICLLLGALARESVNLDMISQSAPLAHSVSLAFTIADADLVQTLRICNELSRNHEGLKPMVSSCNCKLQLYGETMPQTVGVAAQAIGCIYQSGAEIGLITTSEVDISCLVPRMDVTSAVDALNAHFSL